MPTFTHEPERTAVDKCESSLKPGPAFSGQNRELRFILHLQQAVGNQAVQRLLQANTEERKTGASTPAPGSHEGLLASPQPQEKQLAANSPAEQEADRIGKSIGESANNPDHADIPAINERTLNDYSPKPEFAGQLQQLISQGRSLSESDRNYYEPRFGRDLSGIQIHDNPEAGKLSRSIGAQAFTFGNHIVMDTQQRPWQGPAGRSLLAHEITHVAQQGGAPRQDMYARFSGARFGNKGGAATTPRIAAKITVTEEMWRERFEMQIKKYRLALESPDIAVRRWSLNQAVQETNVHLGTAKGTYTPPQAYTDKVEGTKPEPDEAAPDPLNGTLKNYVDNFDSWSYDVNYDIVKTGGGEWAGASPWLTLHFGGTSINVDMRQINEKTLTFEEIKAAFEARYTRQGIVFPCVLSPSTASHVVDAMAAAREERDAAFAFTNSLMIQGVGAFFMTWPGISPAGGPAPGGAVRPRAAAGPGAWTQRASRLEAIRQTRVAFNPCGKPLNS